MTFLIVDAKAARRFERSFTQQAVLRLVELVMPSQSNIGDKGPLADSALKRTFALPHRLVVQMFGRGVNL